MKHFLFGWCALLISVVFGVGVSLGLKNHREVAAFSATTTARVLEKRVETRHRSTTRAGERSYAYVPVVKYRYRVDGREFTGENLYPVEVQIGGNVGRVFAQAPLDQFEQGEETRAWYNPQNPAEACLIRRPSGVPYFFAFLPVVLGSAVYAGWRSSALKEQSARRRAARCVTIVWHGVGIAAAAHYLSLVGSDVGGAALLIYGVYTQLGLIPLAFALPDHPLAGRFKGALAGSLFGAFAGFWLGIVVSFIAGFFSASATFRLRCVGYGAAVPAIALALLGLAGRATVRSGRDRSRRK